MKYKIAFYQPPSFVSMTGDSAPLGLLALASYISWRGLAECRVYSSMSAPSPEQCLTAALNWCDAIAISAQDSTYMFARPAVKLAHAAKKPIIFGGHTATYAPQWVSEDLAPFSKRLTIVSGYGEVAVANWIESGFAASAGVVEGGGAPDSFMDSDLYVYGKKKLSKAILESRGCPFRCGFCQSLRNFIPRDPRLVIEEAERAVGMYGYDCIDLIAGTVFLPSPKVYELAERWRSSPILRNVHVSGCGKFGKALVKPETYDPWRGLIDYIFFSVEGGADGTLKRLGKNFTVEEILDGMCFMTSTYKVPVYYLSGIVAMPNETADDVNNLESVMDACIDMVERAGSRAVARVYSFIPMFGSDIRNANPPVGYSPAKGPRSKFSNGHFWYGPADRAHRKAVQGILAKFGDQ